MGCGNIPLLSFPPSLAFGVHVDRASLELCLKVLILEGRAGKRKQWISFRVLTPVDGGKEEGWGS